MNILYDNYKKDGIFYDFDTKNQSFLTVSAQLSDNGIKNNKFLLTIRNLSLIGIDPWDPNLSDSVISDIIEECSNNIFYFLREVVRIPEQGAGTVPFKLDRGNLAMIYCALLNGEVYIRKSRQTFTTGTAILILLWKALFDKDMKSIPSVGSYNVTATSILQNRIKCFSEVVIPYYLQKILPTELTKEIDLEVDEGFQLIEDIEFATGKMSSIYNTLSDKPPREIGSKLDRTLAPRIIMSQKPFDAEYESKSKYFKDYMFYKWSDSAYDDFWFISNCKYRTCYIEYDFKDCGYGKDYFVNMCRSLGVDEKSIETISSEILLL